MIAADTSKAQRNLTALVDFSRVINASRDLNFTLKNVLLSCFGKFLISRGAILLRGEEQLSIGLSQGISPDALAAFHRGKYTEFESVDEITAAFGGIFQCGLFAKLEVSGKLLGYAALGKKLTGTPYTEEEIEFVNTLLNISSTAVENAQFISRLQVTNRDLDGRVQRLNALFEMSKEFGALLDEDRISRTLLFSLLGNFLVSAYMIVYREGKGNYKILQSTVSKNIAAEWIRTKDISPVTEPLTGTALAEFLGDSAPLKAAAAVPMLFRNEVKGLIILGPRPGEGFFNASDFEFISSLGALAVISLENRRLFKEAIEKQKMEEELAVAKDIQQNLLPKSLPVSSVFDCAAVSISSKQVGGDYYDVFRLNDGTILTAIADVSGKGVPASLLMANLQAFLKSVVIHRKPIEESTAVINDLVTQNTTDGRFITFFWTELNEQNCSLQYVNAGHNPPMLCRDGKIQYLETGGMIFGVIKTLMPYQSENVQLQKDDVLVLFTDGVTEAKNSADDEYGEARLEEIIKNYASLPAQDILQKIRTDVELYVNGWPQSDDITIIVIKVK